MTRMWTFSHMCRMIWEKFQVVWTAIHLVMVYVMYDLFLFEFPTQFLFHDQPMNSVAARSFLSPNLKMGIAPAYKNTFTFKNWKVGSLSYQVLNFCCQRLWFFYYSYFFQSFSTIKLSVMLLAKTKCKMFSATIWKAAKLWTKSRMHAGSDWMKGNTVPLLLVMGTAQTISMNKPITVWERTLRALSKFSSFPFFEIVVSTESALSRSMFSKSIGPAWNKSSASIDLAWYFHGQRLAYFIHGVKGKREVIYG